MSLAPLFDPAFDAKPEAEKPQRWKGRWLFRRAGKAICFVCRKAFQVEQGDELLTHCYSWPTKEACDQACATSPKDTIYIGAIRVD